jgi:hypothetical protein
MPKGAAGWRLLRLGWISSVMTSKRVSRERPKLVEMAASFASHPSPSQRVRGLAVEGDAFVKAIADRLDARIRVRYCPNRHRSSTALI